MPNGSAPRELKQARQLTIWISIAILLGGVVAIAAYFGVTPAPTPSSVTWVPSQILYLLASILISSALISLVLSASTIHESRLQVREEIEQSVKRVLSPMRELIEDRAQRDYRWHCLLDMPTDPSDLPDFAVVEIEISKEVRLLPDTMRFICMSAPSDEVFRPYRDDPGYFLRWIVDRTLDPTDSGVFTLRQVRVDGEDLSIETTAAARGLRAAEYFCRTKNVAREQSIHRVDLQFRAREYVGSDRYVTLTTQIFSVTYGAEFRCTVGGNMRVASFDCDSATGVTGLGNPPSVTLTRSPFTPGAPCTISVRYSDAPILPVSTVAFIVERVVGK